MLQKNASVQSEQIKHSTASREQRSGRILQVLGVFGLLVALGIIIGYYLGECGISWLPAMLQLLLIICLLSLLLLVVGWSLQDKAVIISLEGIRFRKRVKFCIILIGLVLTGRLVVYWMQEPSPLTNLTPAEFNQAFEMDLLRYREIDSALEEHLARLQNHGEFFDTNQPRVLTADEEKLVREIFAGIYDLAFGLDQIRLFYEDWYRFDPSRNQRSYHLRSFLLTYASELSLYEKSTWLATLIEKNPNVVKFLNAPDPAGAFGENAFSQFRQELQGTRDQARVLAGKKYLQGLDTALDARLEAQSLGCGGLLRAIDREIRKIEAFGLLDLTKTTLKSDFGLIKDSVSRVWYPAQKGVAEWMGDTRLRRIGRHLITNKQLDTMEPHLQTGDIILSRKNWYLSNVGLPGFWPHAELYIGDPEKFQAFFDDPSVHAWLKLKTDRNLSFDQYLSQNFPKYWLEYISKDSDQPYRVIEGISEGIVFNTLPKASGDYLAVLRPRLDKVAKAQAVVEAFSHLGKPYDFNFDFATDHILVCTELVYRAYRPAEGKKGLNFNLVEIAGRMTLPANEMARTYALEYGKEDRQLDFVYFIDARESDEKAFVADEQAFRESYQRQKWDLFVE